MCDSQADFFICPLLTTPLMLCLSLCAGHLSQPLKALANLNALSSRVKPSPLLKEPGSAYFLSDSAFARRASMFWICRRQREGCPDWTKIKSASGRAVLKRTGLAA
jgi:hypothetical protein